MIGTGGMSEEQEEREDLVRNRKIVRGSGGM